MDEQEVEEHLYGLLLDTHANGTSTSNGNGKVAVAAK